MCWVGGECVYFRRDMHLKVLSNLVLAVMADGQSFLHGKKPVYSSVLSHSFLSGELEFSANQHMYRVDNIVDERLVSLEMHTKHLSETYFWP